MELCIHPDSVLFLTLDSCRFDSFRDANIPELKSLAPLHKAQAPSYFTYGSHAAFWMGFTLASPLRPRFLGLIQSQASYSV